MTRSPKLRGADAGIPAPRPVYLGDGARASFGMLHEPAGDSTGCAVLICPPFGNSDNGSYMPRRTWAQRLAAAGHPVLRLDLPGTGDSPGGPGDAGIAEGWIGAIAEAARWLRTGYEARVAAIGLGLGGLIACRAAELAAPIDDLVLWAVPSRGRQFLRELRMFEAMLAAHVYEDDSGESSAATMVTESHADGSLESAGFVLSAESVQAIRTLDLAELSPGTGRGRRVLVLDRDGMEVEDRLVGALEGWGADVERAAGPGFWEMMAAPYESVAPQEVMATVDAWLGRAPATAGDAAGRDGGAGRDDAAARGGAVEMRMRSDGALLCERPIAVEHPGGRLLAILTTPVGEGTAPAAAAGSRAPLTLVLVNSGTLRRVGPNRMWVELARRWAARGLPAIRFDLSRESDLSPEILGRFHPAHARPGDIHWDHFDTTFPVQYGAVVDDLVRRGLGPRFMVFGLSSGAYWSLDRLRADERIAAAALINCPRLRWDELAHAQHDLRMLRDRDTWRRILRGEVSTERLLGAGRMIARQLPAWRSGRSAPVTVDEVDILLEGLTARDQQLTFVFAAAEPLRLELERSGRMADLQATGRVVVEHLESPLQAHVLESVALQRAAHDALDRAVTRALDRTARPATPAAGEPA